MNTHVTIVDGPVPTGAEAFETHGEGAVLSFQGVVRPDEAGQPIKGLEYEVYEPMAQTELTRLCSEAIKRFGLLTVRLTHSKGFVAVGQVSLAIEIRAAHRGETLEAMGWLIDTLKRDVPIWKKDVTGLAPSDRKGT